MSAWLSAFFAWLKSLQPQITKALQIFSAGMVGAKLQQGKEAEDALVDVELAAKAASRVELISDADVVSELKERRLYRVSGK